MHAAHADDAPGSGSASLALHRRLGKGGFGRWLAARLICWRAPYFASIGPMLEHLEPGHCIATIRHRRRVQNHLGSVHAIALCNLAEFVAGLATDAAMTRALRWIPKGMSVRYLKRAVGRMRAEARLDGLAEIGAGAERIARVTVTDPAGVAVFSADITMWVSPRRS